MSIECEACEGIKYIESYCGACNGSGEGWADGTKCGACGGSGSEREECEACQGTGIVDDEGEDDGTE